MSDHDPAPQELPAGAPRLLTISQAAGETGLSHKALARRIERGTLRAVHDDQGRRVVPRAELERAGLLGQGNTGGALIIWREFYEQEREEREEQAERARQLERELTALAYAGPFRAIRLRREARRKLSQASVSEAGFVIDGEAPAGLSTDQMIEPAEHVGAGEPQPGAPSGAT